MVLRAERTGLEKRFFELCEEVIPQTGLELYDLDYLPGSSELRVYIRDPKTKTAVLEDCIAVDRALTPFLEGEWTPEKLTLEVSSPGLFRSLRTHEQFKEVVGEAISVTLSKKVEGEGLPPSITGNKKLRLDLVGVQDDGLKVRGEGQEFFIQYDSIKKANLETELARSET
jgi:ribosome maturation factor RimP